MPTQRPFRVFIVTIHDVADGQIVHDRRVFDISGLLLQLAQGDDRAEETPASLPRCARRSTVRPRDEDRGDDPTSIVSGVATKGRGLRSGGHIFAVSRYRW